MINVDKIIKILCNKKTDKMESKKMEWKGISIIITIGKKNLKKFLFKIL